MEQAELFGALAPRALRVQPHTRRRRRPSPDSPGDYARAHPGAHGQARTGVVHAMTPAWLPACGTANSGWDPHALVATYAAVSCQRCDARTRQHAPEALQLVLFEIPPIKGVRVDE